MHKLVQTLALVIAAACASPSPKPAEPLANELDLRAAGKSSVQISATTILPERFAAEAPVAAPKITASTQILGLAQISRPRAELRSGPGVQFELGDAVLPVGTRVLVTSRFRVWRRVLVLDSGEKGWVHKLTLAPAQDLPATMTLNSAQLATVLAVRDVKKAQTYPQKEPVAVAIPRGRMFYALIADDPRTLVWLPETNSVLWVSGKDVQ